MDELQAKYKQLIDQLQTDLSSQIIQKYSQIIEANHQEYFKQLNKQKQALRDKHGTEMKEAAARAENEKTQIIEKCEKEMR